MLNIGRDIYFKFCVKLRCWCGDWDIFLQEERCMFWSMYPSQRNRGLLTECMTELWMCRLFLHGCWRFVLSPVPMLVMVGRRHRHGVRLACWAVSGTRWASSWTWPRPASPKPSPSARTSCRGRHRWDHQSRRQCHPGCTRCLCNGTGTVWGGWGAFSWPSHGWKCIRKGRSHYRLPSWYFYLLAFDTNTAKGYRDCNAKKASRFKGVHL